MDFITISKILLEATDHDYSNRPVYYEELYKKFSRMWNDIMVSDNLRDARIRYTRERIKMANPDALEE